MILRLAPSILSLAPEDGCNLDIYAFPSPQNRELKPSKFMTMYHRITRRRSRGHMLSKIKSFKNLLFAASNLSEVSPEVPCSLNLPQHSLTISQSRRAVISACTLPLDWDVPSANASHNIHQDSRYQMNSTRINSWHTHATASVRTNALISRPLSRSNSLMLLPLSYSESLEIKDITILGSARQDALCIDSTSLHACA